MEHPPARTFDLAAFAARIVWAGICSARHEPSEMKHRIMTAYEHGHLTFEECDFLIPVLGLTEA